uniref:EML-like first beta-propeller domain-containing protein n=1 Tax=Leptocylindrus danicus TaxID=163516 RepID=A0A7S2NUH5_9STRA|mmetsp:Transcript_13453/g.19995  ORF Transcript_13453/g.19995 Transcript_13453/m.19995 type:complete len:659 (+) Transcript_13453:579-2555(+)
MNSIYDKSTLIPPLCENELPQDLHALYHIFGMDSSRTDVIMLNEFEILYTAGNAVIQFNTLTKRRKYVIGIDGGGIGCIRLHSDRKHLFVGEQGTSPAIYVYTLPDYNIVKRLQGGTERGYACMDISIDGNKLCSVGMKPDYTMAVWDWKEEKIILRAKAFGQQIYRVAFSPYEDGRIVTSGSGHIRFWTMANTFTGLKLQGDIGKFGKADLSDIHAFVELPDGKVLSGSESGHLLLWEGRYIKCRFITEEKADNFNKEAEQESNKVGSKPAHEGGIFSIRHDIERNQIISAGADGSIRWWPAHIIDTAETDHDATIDFLITPDREYFIQKDLKINNVLAPPEKSSGEDDSSTLLVVDANCSIWRSTLSDDGVTEQEMECHCGEVVGLATSPMEHIAVTAGRDGSVRFWDYVCKSKIADMRFGCACSSLKWIPKEIDHKVRSIAVGFVDGTLRLLCLNGDELVLLKTIKPHDGEITSIDFSSYGEYTATSSMDGTISILQLGADSNGSFSASNIQPLGYIQSKEGAVAGISWAEQSLLYTTKSGKLVEIDISGQTNFEVHSVPDDFMLSLNQIICKSGISCAITLPAENRAQVPFLWGTIGSTFGGTIHCGILQGDEYIKTYHSGKSKFCDFFFELKHSMNHSPLKIHYNAPSISSTT